MKRGVPGWSRSTLGRVQSGVGRSTLGRVQGGAGRCTTLPMYHLLGTPLLGTPVLHRCTRTDTRRVRAPALARAVPEVTVTDAGVTRAGRPRKEESFFKAGKPGQGSPGPIPPPGYTKVLETGVRNNVTFSTFVTFVTLSGRPVSGSLSSGVFYQSCLPATRSNPELTREDNPGPEVDTGGERAQTAVLSRFAQSARK